ELLAVSALVEDMITKACRSLRERRADIAQQVIASDSSVDSAEVRIEEECLKILALHQPVAIDLRRTATVLKINNDLERIADLAVNIAERALSLAGRRDFQSPSALDLMSERAITMVREAIDAFVHMDTDAAYRICGEDDEVDRYNVQIINEIHDTIRTQPHLVEPAMHFFSATRHVERIADHATNIAEDVIYLVKGSIARHQHTLRETIGPP
ncbi:MAG: phosphate signaling complex protein PhoU, partial [Planctomycetota bacterium]|nr:phosphate signaling complex protein PhoU [Planctomycetota bacterium]